MKMKLLAIGLSVGAAGLLMSQLAAQVKVVGGLPVAPANQAFIMPNGDVAVVYANGGNIVVPGQPPNRVFTNAAGDIGIVWNAPPPPPQTPPAVVNPLPVQAPAAPVVVEPAPRPPNRVVTNQNGDILVIW